MFFDFDLLAVDSLGEALGRQTKRTLSDLAKGIKPQRRALKPATEEGMAFEPLKYNPSERELMGAQAIRFKDITVLAKEYPHKMLSLCPVTTGGEWAGLYRQGKALKSWEQIPSGERKHLLDLSRVRAKAVLKNLGEAGIAKNRIKVCEPSLKLTDDGPSFLSAVLK